MGDHSKYLSSAVPTPALDEAAVEASKKFDIGSASSGLIALAASAGFITEATGSGILALLALIPGAVAYGLTLYSKSQALYRTAVRTQAQVTPITDPGEIVRGQRVPLTPDLV